MPGKVKTDQFSLSKNDSLEDEYADLNFDLPAHLPEEPDGTRNQEVIANSTPSTELELALQAELDRQFQHNELLAREIKKLRIFISKRKQVYKRKRKDESAPRKKLSGYNLFVRERFAKIAAENERALQSADTGAKLKRSAPSSNIASSGHAWSQLSPGEKARYNEMARPDKARFEKETASYQAPDRLGNRKRNKTGYNIFFSQHVLKLKTHEGGLPSERGSVARVVGDAWKKMSVEEKDEYEREADRQNELDPVDGIPQQLYQESSSQEMQSPEMEGGDHPHRMEPPPHHLDSDHEHEHEHHPPPHHHEHPPPPHPMMDPHMEDGALHDHDGSLHDHDGALHDGSLGHPPPMEPPPHGDPNAMHPHGMHPPPYPPEHYPGYAPPPVIHQPPPGYDPATGYYGGPPPPYDPYAYPPPPYPPGAHHMPPGMPPPHPGAEGMHPGPYGPPPPNYQGHPPPPYV